MYFFITGSASTGKTFIVNLIVNELKKKKQNYLILAPMGVAAVNVNGQTIYSALRICFMGSSYQTLTFSDQNFNQELRNIRTILIEEISMVSSELFTFISQIFSNLHHNPTLFNNINVLVFGDLVQLPPINNHPVYKSSI